VFGPSGYDFKPKNASCSFITCGRRCSDGSTNAGTCTTNKLTKERLGYEGLVHFQYTGIRHKKISIHTQKKVDPS